MGGSETYLRGLLTGMARLGDASNPAAGDGTGPRITVLCGPSGAAALTPLAGGPGHIAYAPTGVPTAGPARAAGLVGGMAVPLRIALAGAFDVVHYPLTVRIP